jgi:NTE family protein
MELGNDRKMLVLQGGGALGAYQAGAYEALHRAGVRPEWVAGISIGGINAAIIAGSPEERRVENLRAFWDMVSSGPSSLLCDMPAPWRKWLNEQSAAMNALTGVGGFYYPRALMPWQYLADPAAQVSFYDTSPLIETLDRLIDFDLVNAGRVRLSLGAVNVATGNFAYFDNHGAKPITARHVAASGALPPGFPPVEIDGEFYWDGGLVSNTPLQWVLDQRDRDDDVCVFQIDLFSARGAQPRDLSDVLAREKEIRYSSRTRHNTDEAARKARYEKVLNRLLDRLPSELRDDPDVHFLRNHDTHGSVTVVHLIYRRKAYETHMMDNEFSRLTMEEHWKAGYDDVMETFRCPSWINRRIPEDGFVTIDHWRHQHGTQSGPEKGASS